MKIPAIIVAAYNRPDSLGRLLHSISNADYPENVNIPLIISIDGGGNKDVPKIASHFNWPHGQIKIIEHKENIGLRNHIIHCGNMTDIYEDIIILEDDLVVSKNYYSYAKNALEFYNTEQNIAGVGLYAYHYNEVAFQPFNPLIDGNGVYFLQHPCSWGQAWTKEHWDGFIEYYHSITHIPGECAIPETIKKWPGSSWKKYFAAYLVSSDKYFVYPQVSYTTNFADSGENWRTDLSFFQVPLENQIKINTDFIYFRESYNKYDAFFEMLPDCLIKMGANINKDSCIDLYGSKPFDKINNKYLLSCRLTASADRTFSGKMKPLLQNIIHNIAGSEFNYAPLEQFSDFIPENFKKRIWGLQQAQGFHCASLTKTYKAGQIITNPLGYFRKKFNP